MNESSKDAEYVAIVRDAIGVCKTYRPKFGHGRKAGFTVEEFQTLYQEDPFYSWLGLDSPFVYAAHRAAGGMTSLYRQIGMGCERLFRRVLEDALGLSSTQSKWSYTVPGARGGKARTLSLDGRIPLREMPEGPARERVEDWLARAAKQVRVADDVADRLLGPVFEVRQGYKSKDSKRQNADVANAANAYANNYLPAVVLLSVQIDGDIEERYSRAQWLMLKGQLGGTVLSSTYLFCREVVGYDLARFFERNSAVLKADVEATIKGLLE